MAWIDIPRELNIDRPAVLRLAAEADADPRTVARVLRGEHVRGRAGERIDRILRARGLLREALRERA